MSEKKIPGLLRRQMEMPVMELVLLAHRILKKNRPKFDLCSIINARSGKCSEDCRFCAQSGHYNTNIEEFALLDTEKIAEQSEQAYQNGAEHFGIVTSGRGLNMQEIERIAEAVHLITEKGHIRPCCSLGTLNREQFRLLKQAGLKRYHHNIETSESFYPQIVTTHSYQERLDTVTAAREEDLEVCSGGLIGLGETLKDRVSMALTLKNLDVQSIPLNVLIPIPGTPMGSAPPLSAAEIIRTIALFRLIHPERTIKIAAGRESRLKEFQTLGFLAGANGMLIGGYLTVAGRSVEEDKKMLEELKDFFPF